MKISLKKALGADYLSILSLIIPAVAILLYIDARYFNLLCLVLKRGTSTNNDPTFFLWMAIATIVIRIPFLVFRIQRIKNHFKEGIEIMGKITYISLFKDRGRIEFSYVFEGREYVSGTAVHQNAYVRSLKMGQQINVVVSKENPKKSFIKEMFV
jgi:hypothetical protein